LVKLVDDDGQRLDVPGGIRYLQESPHWKFDDRGRSWVYLGPTDVDGYPVGPEERGSPRSGTRGASRTYQERFDYLTSTEEGYKELTEYAEREGIELSEAANRLMANHKERGFPKPPSFGQRASQPTNWAALDSALDESMREEARQRAAAKESEWGGR
jgi:hypothetical protein